MKTDIRFIGSEFDGAQDDLGEFEHTVKSMVDDDAFGKFGKEHLPPTDIEILPTIMDEALFVITAWHETAGELPARLQYHDLSFRMKLHREDMFAVTDTKHEYRLTTRETLLLSALGGIAAFNSFISLYKE